MKRSHAARHRHLAAQRKAASSRMDRRIKRDALGKEAARRARQAKARFTRWDGWSPLRLPAFGPVTFTLPAVEDGSTAWAERKRWA